MSMGIALQLTTLCRAQCGPAAETEQAPRLNWPVKDSICQLWIQHQVSVEEDYSLYLIRDSGQSAATAVCEGQSLATRSLKANVCHLAWKWRLESSTLAAGHQAGSSSGAATLISNCASGMSICRICCSSMKRRSLRVSSPVNTAQCGPAERFMIWRAMVRCN